MVINLSVFVEQVFEGNEDSKTPIKRVLLVPVEAKYIRIVPVTYEGWPCLRAELYGKGNLYLSKPAFSSNYRGEISRRHFYDTHNHYFNFKFCIGIPTDVKN